MLYTKESELRNGVNCLEALMNNKTNRLETVFFPCNFKDDQKWNFIPEEGGPNNIGTLINSNNGKCLTFSKENDRKGNNKVAKKKEKMLAFLAKVVKETIQKVEAPFLSDCEAIERSSSLRPMKTIQKWLMMNMKD